MARKVRHSALESRSARFKLKVQRKPYPGPTLARGISLLYRRNRTNGAWVVKVAFGKGAKAKGADVKGGYWTKRIGDADDFEESDHKTILTFFEAQDVAKRLARGGDGPADSAPITVDAALKDYGRDLEARNADTYNAEHPRVHLTAALLAKPVALLTTIELRKWRDGLLGKIAPATITRLCNSLCAALELASQHDERIKNKQAWETGLEGLPGAQKARNVVLTDDQVRAFATAAYARDAGLGLLVDVLANTGARPSQATRLLVEDLQDCGARPKLKMPKSGKGGGRNRSQKKFERFSVPITVALAAKLREAAGNRLDDMPLLLRSDGNPWGNDPSGQYREDVREIVKAIGLNASAVTLYCLRHSSITRMLLRNVPIRLVASLHDTSVGQIESNYSKYITEHSDDHARAALLHPEPPPAGENVIPLPVR
jgi:integrase